MALQSSGTISLNDIAGEFGGSTPHSLSEYYIGGGNVPDSTANSSIPTSGQISFSQFYGGTNISVVGQITVNSLGEQQLSQGKTTSLVNMVSVRQTNLVNAGGSWGDRNADVANSLFVGWMSSNNGFITSTLGYGDQSFSGLNGCSITYPSGGTGTIMSGGGIDIVANNLSILGSGLVAGGTGGCQYGTLLAAPQTGTTVFTQ